MRKFLALFLLILLFASPVAAKKHIKPYMVQTVDEWETEASNVLLENRTYERQKPEIKAKLNKVVDPTPYFSKYNLPSGGYEVDLSEIKREKSLRSMNVVSPAFDKMATVVYYYAPLNNQISSELFIVPLDMKKTRVNRILDARVIDKNKGLNLTSGAGDFQENLYSALSVVDWSPEGRAVLIKEKLGSSDSGIFRTNLYAVLVGKEENTIKKFPQLQETIINYWREHSALILNRYRWDIKILGFDEKNPDKALVMAYAFSNDNKETALGLWSVDIYTDEINLISLNSKDCSVSVNGVILKFKNN